MTEPSVAAVTTPEVAPDTAPSAAAPQTQSTEAAAGDSVSAAEGSATDAAAAVAAVAAAAADDASRKRRSRWAPAPAAPPAAAPVAAAAGGEELGEDGQPKKRSRWSRAAATPAADPQNSAQRVLETLTPEQLEAFKIQLRIDEITRSLLNPAEALREKEEFESSRGRARSPSPEPLYDAAGVRMNTRPQRYAKTLERERQELIESLQKANPHYRPPAGFKKIRYERRLPIPVKEYPEYNFIGMIIGPRGHTQKRMEKESGCKIVIRGRGSTQPGRANHRPQPGDDDDLHVLISGDDEAIVIATTKEVEKLLIPIDESKNEHKARQLRELAVINGTLRDEIICRLCGQAGHRQIQCPQRNQSWQPANIRCNICGSDLHPAADCPQRGHRTAEQAEREMDDEYSSFMEEITGTKSGPIANRSAQPLQITDGGGGGGGGGAAPPPPSAPSGGSSGFIHPDRLASGVGGGGAAGGGYRDRDGGSRMVKGADPRENFREFRPAAAAVSHLPAVSHRDGFRDAPASHHAQHHHHQSQHHAYPPPQHYGGYDQGGYGHHAQHHAPYGGGGYGAHHAPQHGYGGGRSAPWSSNGGGHRGQPPVPGAYPPQGGYDQTAHAPSGGYHAVPPPPPPPGF